MIDFAPRSKPPRRFLCQTSSSLANNVSYALLFFAYPASTVDNPITMARMEHDWKGSSIILPFWTPRIAGLVDLVVLRLIGLHEQKGEEAGVRGRVSIDR